MKDYDRMNPISARNAIKGWLADIKKKSQEKSVGQDMVEVYGGSKNVKNLIKDMFSGEG